MDEGFEDQIKRFLKGPAVFRYHGTGVDIHILGTGSCHVPAISQKGTIDLVVQTETQESWFIVFALSPLTPTVGWPLTLNGYPAAGRKGQRVATWVGMGEAKWARRLAGGLPQGFRCRMQAAPEAWNGYGQMGITLRNTTEGQLGSLMGWRQDRKSVV